MKKYNNITGLVNFSIIFINIIGIILSLYFGFVTRGSIRIISLVIISLFVILSDVVYFLFLGQWYFTYFDENEVLQIWMLKVKSIEYKDVKHIYLIDNIIFLSKYELENIDEAKKIKHGQTKRIKRSLRKGVCIIVNQVEPCLVEIIKKQCSSAKVHKINIKDPFLKRVFA